MKKTLAPSPAEATELRCRAEARLKDKKQAQAGKGAAPPSAEETQRLLQELQIHQIELEMQNEDLRRIQGDLEASQARYFDLYDLAPAGYCTLNEQGMILELNLAAAALLGAARSALIKKPLTRFILPGDQDICHRHRKLLFETGKPQICELRLATKDAAPVWVRIDAIAAQEADGVPVCHATMIDITDRKQSEKALRESEELFRSYLESAPDGIYINDLEGTFLYGNRKCEEIIGYRREELIGKNFLELNILSEDSLSKAVRVLQSNMEGRSTGPDEIELISKEGRLIPVEINTSVVQRMGQRVVLSFARDITDRKRADEQGKETHALLRIAGEKAKLGGWIVNLEENRVVWSDEVAAIHEMPAGYSPLVEQDISFYAPQWRERITKVFTDCTQKGIPYDEEMEIITAGGKRVWVRTIGEAVKDNAGKIIKVQGAFQDITERKQAEEALRESEERYRNAEAVGHTGNWEYNLQTQKFWGSDEAKRIYGFDPAVLDFSTGDVESCIPERERVHQALVDLIYADKRYHLEFEIHPKNSLKPRTISSIAELKRDEHGNPLHVTGVILDITERKLAEESLRQAEENYRSIFENAQEGIYRTTPEGKFIMANQAMARILGYDSPEELLAGISDITHQVYVHPEERVKTLELLERQGFVNDNEVQLYRKDGRMIWIYRTIRAIHNERGQLLYIEGLVTDITDRKNSFDQLRKALGGTVQAIASVVETKDPYTAGHQRRVADLARTIAGEMGLSKEQTEGLRVASTIHDIGKVSVPAEILSSPRKLTDLELSLIETHVQSGYDILKDIDFPWPIARMVLEHHERINGSGYPNGLTGDQILIESRILAVADVVEAMATHRPYRAALGLDKALEEITQNKGILYDSEVVDACLCLFRKKGYEIKE